MITYTDRRILVPALLALSGVLFLIAVRRSSAGVSCGAAGMASCSASVAPAAAGVTAATSQEQEPSTSAAGAISTLQGILARSFEARPAAPLPARGGQGGNGLPTVLSSITLPAGIQSTNTLPGGANTFAWPVVGPLTQAFGVPELGVGAPHTGIDIGQDMGSPVRAAQTGRVVFAGGDPCCGLGYWVEINHGNRYATRYGHLMRPPIVLAGEYVTQGQIIGFSGTTGFSTGPHVHFELRLDGVPIDPLRLLPTR